MRQDAHQCRAEEDTESRETRLEQMRQNARQRRTEDTESRETRLEQMRQDARQRRAEEDSTT